MPSSSSSSSSFFPWYFTLSTAVVITGRLLLLRGVSVNLCVEDFVKRGWMGGDSIFCR